MRTEISEYKSYQEHKFILEFIQFSNFNEF